MKNEQEIIKDLVEIYLNKTYKLSLDDLDKWYGFKLCKFVTTLKNDNFEFVDILDSSTPNIVTYEINNEHEYDISNIDFKPGDIVIDIGANIGMISIFLAKKISFLKNILF